MVLYLLGVLIQVVASCISLATTFLCSASKVISRSFRCSSSPQKVPLGSPVPLQARLRRLAFATNFLRFLRGFNSVHRKLEISFLSPIDRKRASERMPAFWCRAFGADESAALKREGGLSSGPCRSGVRFGFGLPGRTASKQGRRSMWRQKHRHIERRPCFSFSAATCWRRDRVRSGVWSGFELLRHTELQVSSHQSRHFSMSV